MLGDFTNSMAYPVDEHIGARIRAIRKAQGLTQDALAIRLGLTFQQIQKYERGINRISASRLFQIAQLLDASVSDFFEGLGPDGEGPDAPFAEPLSFAAKVAASADLRRLVRAYESLATPWERARLVEAVEVIVRQDDSDEGVSP